MVVFGTPTEFNSGFTSTTTGTQSFTVSAGDDGVLVCEGGFRSGGTLSTGVTIDGNAMTLVNRDVYSTGGQSAGIYVITSSDAGWPGTGTFDVVVTTALARQQRLVIIPVTDWDLTTPSDDNDTATGNGTSISGTVNSAVNDLCISNVVYFRSPTTTISGGTEIFI